MKNLYFNYIILSLIFIGFFYSCTMEGYDEEVLYINAKVENASRYNNIVEVRIIMYNSNIDKDVELARGEWKDGGFTISLPKTVDSNYLYSLIDNEGASTTIIDTPSTLNINNRKIKIWNTQFRGVDKNGNLVTHFYPFEIEADGNIKGFFYTYADSDVTISGYTEREGAIITEYDVELFRDIIIMRVWWDKITTSYSVKWKKGWNIWGLSRFYNIPERIVTEKWSSTPTNKLNWYGGEDLRKLNL